jgi:NAD(P)-dependent dehydrogenase (short-subunit alcohol dehydrogenase family)
VTCKDDIQRVVDETVAAFGRIDILSMLSKAQQYQLGCHPIPLLMLMLMVLYTTTFVVNNAGTAVPGFAASLSEEEWDSLMNLNLKSAFFFTQAVVQVMLDKNIAGVCRASASYLQAHSAMQSQTLALGTRW